MQISIDPLPIRLAVAEYLAKHAPVKKQELLQYLQQIEPDKPLEAKIVTILDLVTVDDEDNVYPTQIAKNLYQLMKQQKIIQE